MSVEEEEEDEFTKFIDAFRAFAPRPAWGDVYNYDEMHGDLLDGFFPSETCEVYYEYYDELEAAYYEELEGTDDEGEEEEGMGEEEEGMGEDEASEY